jgi:hypothetical protein
VQIRSFLLPHFITRLLVLAEIPTYGTYLASYISGFLVQGLEIHQLIAGTSPFSSRFPPSSYVAPIFSRTCLFGYHGKWQLGILLLLLIFALTNWYSNVVFQSLPLCQRSMRLGVHECVNQDMLLGSLFFISIVNAGAEITLILLRSVLIISDLG